MDLRFTLRTLAKQPGFCVAAILTLALGIGANTAIFSVFDAVILRPFPYRDPGRVVMVWQKRPNGQMNSVAGIHYHEWIKQSTMFEKLAAIIPESFNVGRGDDISQVYGARVSSNFFSTLGVQPALGRDFAPGEEKPGAERVAILSYGLWRSQFGGDRSLLGRPIRLNGEPFVLIGVLPQNFDFVIEAIDVWVPLIFREGEVNATKMAVLGRMKQSVSEKQAGGEMDVIAQRLGLQFSDYKGWGAIVISLPDIIGGGHIRPALTALMVGAGLVLLIACANVANLLVARSGVRYKEIAIRSALGANWARLIGLLLTEAMLLALAGCLAGLALAYAGLRLLVTVAAGQLPRIESVALDARVLGFTVLITAITGLLFGLFPAHQLLGGDLQLALRESGRGSNNNSSGRRSRNVLVVSEIALSLVLAIGATLMVRSLLWLENQDRGFSPDHQLSFRVALSSPELSNSSQRAVYYQRMLERIKELPGARAVAATNNLPVDGYRQVGMYFKPDGSSAPDSADRPSAAVNMINPGYFQALGIPIIRGREFDERDHEHAPSVAIISNALARQFFPGRNPVGHKLMVGDAGIEYEIVGVAGDVRYLTKRPVDSEEIYLPYAQKGWPAIHVIVRTDGDPGHMAPAVRAALLDAGWRQPIFDVRTMAERIDTVNGRVRLNSLLATTFAVIALLLAGVGIYGVMSYSVVQRSKEIGIRVALGATGGDILRWIVRQAMVLAAAGVAIGLAGHFALARVLGSLLYGTSPNDVSIWMGSAALLGLIAVVASYIPARRAMRSDPATALRAE
jgi:putative ABC transport system permease protein